MTKTILFISDTSDGQNWGCFATSHFLRRLINDSAIIEETIFLEELYHQETRVGFPSIPDIQYVLREWAKVHTEEGDLLERFYRYGVQPMTDILDYLPMTASQFSTKATEFEESGLSDRFFGSIEDVDEVVINGEGSIHGPGRKAKMLLFLAYLAKDRYDVDTHIINHTLQMNDPDIEEMVKLVYPTLDTLVFRDPLSMKHYLSEVEGGNVVQGADAAWCFDEMLSARELNEICTRGGISIWYPRNEDGRAPDFTRSYITIGGGSGFARLDTDTIAEGFIEIIQSIERETPDVGILLTAAGHSDEQFMLKVSEETGHPLVKLNNTSRVAASIVGNSEVYLGGRWHPSIFALLGGARLVNFNGNTFKIKAIKHQFDLEHPIYRCKEIGSQVDEIATSVSQRLACTGERNTPTGEEIEEMRGLARMNVNAIFG